MKFGLSLSDSAQSTFKEPYLCILKLFGNTLRDSAITVKIYCTEMHDLSKDVNLSRVCGLFSVLSRVGHIQSGSYGNICEYLQVLNDFIYFVNTSIHLIQKRLSSELLYSALRSVAYTDRKAPWI